MLRVWFDKNRFFLTPLRYHSKQPYSTRVDIPLHTALPAIEQTVSETSNITTAAVQGELSDKYAPAKAPTPTQVPMHH